MASYTKNKLSGSTNGRAIRVSGTGTGSAVTVHQAVTGSTDWDEVWVYANNTSGTATKLTLEWGTTTAIDGNIELTISAESGLVLVIPGLILQNSLLVKAFAATADVILLTGYVHNITA
jgi:hypothetical protein